MVLSKRRIFALVILFSLLFLFLAIRLSYLQFSKPHDLGNRAQRQSRLVIEVPPFRGRILDRNGSVLALDIQKDSLGAHARDVIDKTQLAETLHGILGVKASDIESRLKRDKDFVWIARKMTDAASKRVQALARDELELRKEWKRIYPNGETGSHVLGFTGLDHHGLEGVEYHFDSYLKGVPGWKVTRRDAKQRELVSKEIDWTAPVDGFDIHLTIDAMIQHLSDTSLFETCQKYKALSGSLVVIDPKDGDILAMSSYPQFDPNNPEWSSLAARRNRAVTDMYEPGSVFKLITLAGLLNEDGSNLKEVFNCEQGAARIGGRILHDTHPYDLLTLEEVIIKSSNIGIAKAATMLGRHKLHEYIRRFGFGETTQVSLPGEAKGMVHHPRVWSKPSLSSIAMGQEVAVTALQVASAYGAIANDGVLVKPRIVTRIESEERGVVRDFPALVKRRVIKAHVAQEIQTVMERVVNDGTGKRAKVQGARVGGKTGTAQKLDANGSYSHDHFVGSFAGFMEYEGRKVVIAVAIDDPRPVYYGGTVAAPLFATLANGILAQWKSSEANTLNGPYELAALTP